MDQLAQLVAGAGVRRVTGDVIGDASAFEARPIPAGWKDTYLHLAYAAPVSALSINENVAWITVAPQGAGAAARVTFEPVHSIDEVSGPSGIASTAAAAVGAAAPGVGLASETSAFDLSAAGF